ncbi:hypothetical protein GCM10023192_65080 [Amycolatopsis samaneae]
MIPAPAGGCRDGCCAGEPPGIAADRRAVLVRRIRLLVAATIGYNVVEAVVALIAGSRVLPLLSAAQRRAGRELGSASAVADARQTLLCT